MEIGFKCIRFRYSSLHIFFLYSVVLKLICYTIKFVLLIRLTFKVYFDTNVHHMAVFLICASFSLTHPFHVSLISTLAPQCLTIKSMTNTIIMLEANSSKINLVNLNSPWPWKNHFPWEKGKKINKDSLTWNEQTSLARKPNARNITTNT